MREIIVQDEDNARVTRLRYVTDGFAPDVIAPDVALNDMTFLCQNMALPNLAVPLDGQTVIISLADRAAPFGVMDSSVAQIFEVFTILDSICIWEAF